MDKDERRDEGRHGLRGGRGMDRDERRDEGRHGLRGGRGKEDC